MMEGDKNINAPPNFCAPSVNGNISANASFLLLLRINPPFRLYLSSCLISDMGGWFSYIACIQFIEDAYPQNYTAISILVVLRMVPQVLFSALGGVLADARDRRRNMIFMDVIAATLSLVYLIAIQINSVMLLYAVMFCSEVIGALYEPSSEAIYPQIVRDEALMEKGVVGCEVAHAAVAAFGACLGGFCAALFGIRACFVIESVSYLTSAVILGGLHGQWIADDDEDHDSDSENESSDDEDSEKQQPKLSFVEEHNSMITSGYHYILRSDVGPFLLIKATGMILFGATEVIAVALSEQPNDPDGSSARLGIIYGFYGLGCLFGPFISSIFTDIKSPITLQIASIVSFAVITLSWMGLTFFEAFASKCILIAVLSCGAEILWLDSDLLLLKFSKNKYLGRVTALDGAMAISCEALSALLAGMLQDRFNLSTKEVSLIFSMMGVVCVIFWLVYHLGGSNRILAKANGNSDGGIKQVTSDALTEESPLLT